MAAVGIGGFFFRSDAPEALMAWYREYLGVGTADGSPWQQQAGPTVFMPFPRDSGYFPADRSWMLNLRVEGLDALLARLRAAGVDVTTDPSWDTAETGRFARIHDPEGNPVELWEPPAD
ncbi:VOC family protein [Phenylobacterium sp.]|uniref:VOC family protein n=1 Tax=Phenylobacterium sp. TaxID=1871053 RepID=UPI0025D1A59D|nr:VOC family protein [Phenylobacterium sp.]